MTLIVDEGVSASQLQFCSIVTAIEKWVGGAFYRFPQLDAWLGSVQDLTPMGDVVLHQMFVQWVGDP